MVKFFELDVKSRLKNKKKLKSYIELIFLKEKHELKKLFISFCTDDNLYKMNKKFLGHDYFTDTLTFSEKIDKNVSGEIFISVDRVRDNSLQFGSDYQDELCRIIFHSCLHLCNYLDKPKNKAVLMAKVQEKYLRNWIVSRETL